MSLENNQLSMGCVARK